MDSCPEKSTRRFILHDVISWIQRLLQPFIILQLTDLRTSVMRDACSLIHWMAQEFPEEFAKTCSSSGHGSRSLSGGNGIKYFRSDALPKLIIGGTKLMQDIGHQTILSILELGVLPKDIVYHLACFAKCKTIMMRLRTG